MKCEKKTNLNANAEKKQNVTKPQKEKEWQKVSEKKRIKPVRAPQTQSINVW